MREKIKSYNKIKSFAARPYISILRYRNQTIFFALTNYPRPYTIIIYMLDLVCLLANNIIKW